MKYKIVLVLIAFATSGQLFAQGIKSLSKGQKFVQVSKSEMEMKMEMMGQQIEQNISINTTAELNVSDLSSIGAKVDMKSTKMKMNMSAMGQEMNYDSEKPDDSEVGKEVGKSLNKVSTLTTNDKGIITSIEMDEDVKSMMKNAPAAGLTKGQPISFLVTLPANAAANANWSVSYGEDSATLTTYNYTIKSIENGIATLSFTGTMKSTSSMSTNGMDMTTKLNGTIMGTALVNVKTNIVKSRNSVIEMKGTMEMSGQSIPLEMKTTSEESFD